MKEKNICKKFVREIRRLLKHTVSSAKHMYSLFFSAFSTEARIKKSKADFDNNLANYYLQELANDDWWNKRHAKCIEQMQEGDIDLLMIGDSITHYWECFGKKPWNRYYGHRKVINLGFAGDTIEKVLWRLNHLPLEKINPKLLILLIGTNDIILGTETPKKISERMLKMVQFLREAFPERREGFCLVKCWT